MPINTRKLGSQGLEVPALGLGCMGMSEFYSGRDEGENFQKNLDLVAEIETMAREKGCTPSQLALAWLLAQGEDIVPIPGTKKRARLEENLGAMDVQVTTEDRARIDRVLPPGAAAGLRYPEPQMQALNR